MKFNAGILTILLTFALDAYGLGPGSTPKRHPGKKQPTTRSSTTSRQSTTTRQPATSQRQQTSQTRSQARPQSQPLVTVPAPAPAPYYPMPSQGGCTDAEVEAILGSAEGMAPENDVCPSGMAKVKVGPGSFLCYPSSIAYRLNRCNNSGNQGDHAIDPSTASCEEAAKTFRESKKNYSTDHQKVVERLGDMKDDLTEELMDNRKELQEASIKLTQLQNEMQAALTKIEKDRDKALQDLKKDADEVNKEMSAKYDELNAAIEQLLDKKEEVNLAVSRKKKEAENRCLVEAKAVIAEEIQKRANLFAKSNLKAKSTKDLFRKSGMDSETEVSGIGYGAYLKCLRGKQHLDAIADIEEEHLLALTRIEREISRVRNAQQKLILDMTSKEREEEFRAALENIQSEYGIAYEQTKADFQARIQEQQARYQAAVENGQRKQKQLELARKALQSRDTAALKASEDSSKRKVDPDAPRFPTLGGIIGDAENVIDACRCSTVVNSANQTPCNEARSFRCATDITDVFPVGYATESSEANDAVHRSICGEDSSRYRNKRGMQQITR